MTDAEILSAINADSTAKALADVGNDDGCAKRLRDTLRVRASSRISIAELQQVAFIRGLTKKIRGAATAGNDAALDAMDLFASQIPDLDLEEPQFKLTIQALIAANLLTSDDIAAIEAIGLAPPNITAHDVSRVMLPARPDGVVPHVN